MSRTKLYTASLTIDELAAAIQASSDKVRLIASISNLPVRKRRLASEWVEKTAALRARGWSWNQIAKQLGRSRSSITTALKKNGYVWSGKKLASEPSQDDE
jgi:DNA-binding NarL/FixJ family response regulator